MKTDLAALLSRLEGGEASRELDCELWSLETGVPLEWQGTTLVAGEHGVIGWCDPGERQRNFSTNRSTIGPGSIPAYTTSLDAALALAERVLPGWGICIRVGAKAVATVVEPDKPDAAILDAWPRKWEAGAPKPALALTAAIVKAKIGEEG